MSLFINSAHTLVLLENQPIPNNKGLGFFFTATGGTPPYTWQPQGGTLPPGVTFNASDPNNGGNASLTGTPGPPTTSYGFPVQVTDHVGATFTQKHFAVVVTSHDPHISSQNFCTVTQGVAMTPFQVTASAKASETVTYGATGLPTGVSISSSGLITGTPSSIGTPTAQNIVLATDANGNPITTTIQAYPAIVAQITATGSLGGTDTVPFYMYVLPNDTQHYLDPSDTTDGQCSMLGVLHSGVYYGASYAAAQGWGTTVVEVPAGGIWDGGGQFSGTWPTFTYTGPVYCVPAGMSIADFPDGTANGLEIRNAAFHQPDIDNLNQAFSPPGQFNPIFNLQGCTNTYIHDVVCAGASNGGKYHANLVGYHAFYPGSVRNFRVDRLITGNTWGDGFNILVNRASGQGACQGVFISNVVINTPGRQAITVGTVIGLTVTNGQVNHATEQEIDFESDLGYGVGSTIGSTDVIFTNWQGNQLVQMIEPLLPPVNNPEAVLYNNCTVQGFNLYGRVAYLSGQTIRFKNGTISMRRDYGGGNPNSGIQINGYYPGPLDSSGNGAVIVGLTPRPAHTVTTLPISATPVVTVDIPSSRQPAVTVNTSLNYTANYNWAGTVSSNNLTGLTYVNTTDPKGNVQAEGTVTSGQLVQALQPSLDPCNFIIEDSTITTESQGNMLSAAFNVFGGGVLEFIGDTWTTTFSPGLKQGLADFIGVSGTLNYGPNTNGTQIIESAGTGIAPVFTNGATDGATWTEGANTSYGTPVTGTPAPTVTITAGTLPSGLNLVDVFGAWGITGTPAAGTHTGSPYVVTLTATNSAGSANQTFTVTVITSSSAPTITSSNHTTFTQGSPSSFQVTATGTPTPVITEVGTLPAGITLSPGGLLSGTPRASGAFPLAMVATNSAGSGNQFFVLTVNAAPIFSSAPSTTFFTTQTNNFTVSATGYPTPTITMTSGTLPTGVFFSNGVFSGNPTAAVIGSYRFTLQAQNAGGTVTQNFTLIIKDGSVPQITSSNIINANTSQSLAFQVTATGEQPITINQTGALPSGLTWNPVLNQLQGTPKVVGTFNISFTATNAAGTTTQAVVLNVSQGGATLTPFVGIF